jgi:hypothetical protein
MPTTAGSLAADPGVQIEWSEVERGHWVATCVCKVEHHREPAAMPKKLDPLDPATAHHLPQGEYIAGETDLSVLKILLKVTEKDGHHWVTCAGCGRGWQVPYYAEESVG